MEIKSVTESILDNLRREILSFKLKGGDRLNEGEISSRLDISRPPLREAFQILEQEHLIMSIPRKGRYVAELSVDNYEKIHHARVMLECYVIEILKAQKIKRKEPDYGYSFVCLQEDRCQIDRPGRA